MQKEAVTFSGFSIWTKILGRGQVSWSGPKEKNWNDIPSKRGRGNQGGIFRVVGWRFGNKEGMGGGG